MFKIVSFLFPILSFPWNLKQFFKTKESSFLLYFCLIIGIFSLFYVPGFTNDKTYYFELYSFLNRYGSKYFLIYLATRQDIVLYYILYFFSLLGVNFNFVIGILSFTTISLISFSSEFFKFKTIQSFLPVVILFLGISFPDFFSGLRFYLAVAFLATSQYFFRSKRPTIGVAILFLSFFTHFSLIAFFWLPFLNYYSFSLKKKYLKLALFFSFVFLFVSVNQVLTFLGEYLFGNYPLVDKITGYADGEDKHLTDLLYGNIFNLIQFVYRMLIYVVLNLSAYYALKFNSRVTHIFILLVIFNNLFFSIPVVYLRFSIVTLSFYLLFLNYESLSKKLTYMNYIYFCGLALLYSIIYSNNIFESIKFEKMITIFDIMSYEGDKNYIN